MPQPLADVSERIELLKMTLGLFAPGEPGPIAAELVELAEDALAHGLTALGDTAAPGGDLMGRLAECQRRDGAYAAVAGACRTVLDCRARVMAADQDADCGAWLQAQAAAAGEICGFVKARVRD